KHPDMKKLAFQARDIHSRELITFTWIPREENSHADRILNDALDGMASVIKEPIQQNFLMERLISGEEPTTIYLVRHGETILTPARKFSGSGPLNPELTDIGIGQAKAVAKEIAKFKPDLLFASPLRRTQETAAQIAESTGLKVLTEDIWIEQSFGKWDGMSVAEVSAQYPDEYKHWLASTSYLPPEGESYDEVSARALQAIDQVATDNPGKKIVAVTHNGIIKTAVAAIINAQPESIFHIDISPCSITTISVWPSDNLMALRGCNERGHLRG
ncbi:MAG: histidine phosphatase family protein, partial [Acidobacteria bacterium]|nr:histidine phosphatase family protein [Acidobacteriota bacterium]